MKCLSLPAALLLLVLSASAVRAQAPATAGQSSAVALATASVGEQNAFAWLLSTAEESSLRDGEVAVEIMESLTASAAHRTSSYLDTLAAAYAEAGRFDDAVAAELEALDALEARAALEARDPSRPPSSYAPTDERRSGMRDRLDRYRSRQPYREHR